MDLVFVFVLLLFFVFKVGQIRQMRCESVLPERAVRKASLAGGGSWGREPRE